MSKTPYDEVAYPTRPLTQAHPQRLGGIGTLHGMRTALPSACRYLELGCGTGQHLIPMAYRYPNSTFVGVDLAGTAIAKGRAIQQRLGLKNLLLLEGDIANLPPEIGSDFDYIVSHGIFSWVPLFVREALLRETKSRLAQQGVGYVSYNAFPGCYMRKMIWEMLHEQVDHFPADQKAARAQEVLALLAQATADKAGDDLVQKASVRMLLRQETSRLESREYAEVLFHDDLAEINDPYRFLAFMKMAEEAGLEYLAEADYPECSDKAVAAGAREEFSRIAGPDRLRREQLLDDIKGRQFRQTLLVHPGACSPTALIASLPRLAFMSESHPLDKIDLAPKVPMGFKTGGGTMRTDEPLVKAAMLELGAAHPDAVGYDELLARSRARLGHEGNLEPLVETLFAAIEVGVVHACREEDILKADPGPRPKVSESVRAELENDQQLVTSLRHRPVHVGRGLTRALLLLLDGTRDRAQIEEGLLEWARREPEETRDAALEAIKAGPDTGVLEAVSMGLVLPAHTR